MIIFSTVLRIFLGKNCLSLIQSVEIVNMVSVTLSSMERNRHKPLEHLIFFLFRNLISQIFKAFFCWVFMHKCTQDNKILYVFFYATHFLEAVESLWATIFQVALSLLSLSLSISFTACDITIKSTHKSLLKSSSIKSLKFYGIFSFCHNLVSYCAIFYCIMIFIKWHNIILYYMIQFCFI